MWVDGRTPCVRISVFRMQLEQMLVFIRLLFEAIFAGIISSLPATTKLWFRDILFVLEVFF